MDKIRYILLASVQNQIGRNTMNRNECQNCKYYEKCGKPSRPIKCMGYEPKEAAVEEQNIERHKANKTQKV
jgi:hypothetical protein